MKFSKKSETLLSRLVDKYKLQDSTGTLKIDLIKTFLQDIEQAKPLFEDYLEFAKTMPYRKGDAIMDTNCVAYIVKYLTYEFDVKGNPYWEKVVAKGLGATNKELEIKDTMPYSVKGKVLFKNNTEE